MVIQARSKMFKGKDM